MTIPLGITRAWSRVKVYAVPVASPLAGFTTFEPVVRAVEPSNKRHELTSLASAPDPEKVKCVGIVETRTSSPDCVASNWKFEKVKSFVPATTICAAGFGAAAIANAALRTVIAFIENTALVRVKVLPVICPLTVDQSDEGVVEAVMVEPFVHVVGNLPTNVYVPTPTG